MMSPSAIVLAAGSSHRMGTPKALLPIGETTFLRHVVETIQSAGAGDIHVVIGASEENIMRELAWFQGSIVVNKEWQRGQLSSIKAGIRSLENGECSGVLIWPVDHPLVTRKTARQLLTSFETVQTKIIIPEYHQRRGHPIVISKDLFHEVLTAPEEIGMRYVVHAHEDDITAVSIEDEGVLINIDSPEDYRKYAANLRARTDRWNIH